MLPTLLHVLDQHAAERGDAPAFIVEGRAVDFAAFASTVDRTAVWLQAHGVRRGDRVAVWLVNRLEWLALYFALARIGAPLVAVNTRYRAHEVGYLLEKSCARLLVMQSNFHSIDFTALMADVPQAALASLTRIAMVDSAGTAPPATLFGKPVIAFALDDLPPAPASRPAGTDADAASILFTTSGTTRGPKLVMHSQRTVAMHAQRVARAHGLLDEGTALLAALPLCGVFGFCAAMAALAAGRPSVLLDTFDATRAARAITQHGITHLFGSDEMVQRLLDAVPDARPFPSLRVVGFAAFGSGADVLARAAWERGVPLLGVYGSSEVQALFALQRATLPLEQRTQAGGMPAHTRAAVRIRDLGTHALLPPGQSGVIEIRSDTSFVGYLDDAAATQAALDAEGFFRTGDIGHLRDDGSLVFETRQGDVMRLGGYLVSPAEIEEALKAQENVAEVQVVAVEIEGRMRAVAFAIAQPGAVLDVQRLQQAVASGLASFKVPARIWQVARFPVAESSNGTKIQRARLREMALQRIAQGDAG
ncbi:AMP-binding protein [Variovorax sp. J22P271]|uniref:AMP-binding protein n=1 Tax=Variovorax davisae TaxID=3053515 RepID=UPI0025778215|nr:AMP-binding protein [Variovorax sp. J22P271]MDM0034343.1 AMP-binding protein [Variovorax sp. J22P271]